MVCPLEVHPPGVAGGADLAADLAGDALLHVALHVVLHYLTNERTVFGQMTMSQPITAQPQLKPYVAEAGPSIKCNLYLVLLNYATTAAKQIKTKHF